MDWVPESEICGFLVMRRHAGTYLPKHGVMSQGAEVIFLDSSVKCQALCGHGTEPSASRDQLRDFSLSRSILLNGVYPHICSFNSWILYFHKSVGTKDRSDTGPKVIWSWCDTIFKVTFYWTSSISLVFHMTASSSGGVDMKKFLFCWAPRQSNPCKWFPFY